MISFDDPLGDGAAPDVRERTARVLDAMTASALVARPSAIAVASDDDDDFLLSDETLDVPPADSPLRRYLPYQVRDFVVQKGSWLFALSMMAIYFLWDNYVPGSMGPRRGVPVDEAVVFRQIAQSSTAAFAMLASLVSVHGIVSAERERGLQRFLFAKPIARVPYYLQKLGIAYAGVMVLTLVATLMLGLVMGQPVPVQAIMVTSTAIFASVGGLAFLLSTLVRFEGLLALALSVAVFPLRALSIQQPVGWAWLGNLRFLFPPLDRLAPLLNVGQDGDPLRAFLTALAYGAAYVAIGVAILRRRSILT